jgi:hypothetical protein
MAGVPPRPIMALLGHRDPRMTLRYQHLSPDHLRDAARALDQRPALVEVAPAHAARPVASAGSARARGAGRQPQATAMMTGASTDHDTDAPSSRWPRWSKARLLAVTSSSPEQLREAIAREQAGLAGLDDERRQAQTRLAALQDALAALEAPSVFPLVPLLPGSTRPESSTDKVALFRQLFRGRDDVYPRLWTNATTGRKGYAPACGNEWVRGICEKPRVKCGECPNQAFIPATDQVILDHLQGRHVVGVYPLLTDETCWFLAADFDKSSWADDVLAFAETCRTTGMPPAVERSRSGQGALAWFLFAAPVAACLAR